MKLMKFKKVKIDLTFLGKHCFRVRTTAYTWDTAPLGLLVHRKVRLVENTPRIVSELWAVSEPITGVLVFEPGSATRGSAADLAERHMQTFNNSQAEALLTLKPSIDKLSTRYEIFNDGYVKPLEHGELR